MFKKQSMNVIFSKEGQTQNLKVKEFVQRATRIQELKYFKLTSKRIESKVTTKDRLFRTDGVPLFE